MTLGRASRAGLATGLAFTLALAGCTATPSTLVVSGTVENRVETVAVPSVSVPAVNLDAGFTTLTGTRNPVTGRTATNLSTVGTTYGFGTFVRLAEVTVAVGDTVTAGQSLGRIDDAALTAQVAAAKADQEAALAQVGLLGDAIDTTYDKQSDVNSALAKVRDAITKIHDGKQKLLKARATIRKNLPLAKQGLAAVEHAIAQIPPGVPVPAQLLEQQKKLTAAIKAMNAGLKKINGLLHTLAKGLKKARSGLRKLEDATAKITDARGTLRDLKDLAAIQADSLKVPVDLARTQVALAGLTSPVNGVVVAAATAGSVLAPGATAVSIRETRPSTVTAWLASDQVTRVCEGDAASIVGDWMTGDGVPATLTRIGTRSDYPPTSVATEEIHLTRAVEVEFTATEQLPAGVPVELHINSCHPAAGNSDSDR
jgi:multidrug resistance efflux pump